MHNNENPNSESRKFDATCNGAPPGSPAENPHPETSAPSGEKNIARNRKPRKLSIKQQAWARAYWNPNGPAFGNATKAAKLAGYKPGKAGSNQLTVQGHRLANDAELQRSFAEILKDAGGTLEHCAARLVEQSNAKKRKAFPGPDGDIVYSEWEPDFAARFRAVDKIVEVHQKARSHTPCRTANPHRTIATDTTAPGEQHRRAESHQEIEELPASERRRLRDAINITRGIAKKIMEAAPGEPPESE